MISNSSKLNIGDVDIEKVKNLNEVMKASNKDAASEVTRLQVLYKSAMDGCSFSTFALH